MRPDNGYGVILADPPWQYRNANNNGAAAKHYPTMDPPQLAQLMVWRTPIHQLAGHDCLLLLWATAPLLDVAIRIVSIWGFTYKTFIPWIKATNGASIDLWGEIQAQPAMGTGFWVRGCSELLLIGVRGVVRPPAPADVPLGLISERLQHSRKPDNAYEYAELFPGPYLELFARRRRAGWDSWGNEITELGETDVN